MLSFRAGTRERIPHVGELSVSVFRSYWGNGIGRALLEALIAWAPSAGITKIDLRVREDNERAIELYKRVGFKKEGAQSRGILHHSKYYDLVLMGLLL